ncbi:MAG: hypothetical protein AAFY15_09265 [Cyanobacteria bacterium J06648_11]
MIRELDIAKKMREVETNEGLSASARETQMADLKKQLDELRSK